MNFYAGEGYNEDFKTDIWSYGVILLELFFGQIYK
jgi:serine/threonine protein kinase